MGGVQVLTQKCSTRFTGWQAFVRKAPVDVLSGKSHAFAGQNIPHELVGGPEGIFGEAGSAQSVLVAHQHQLILGQIAGNARQGADCPGQKLEFIGREAVDLLAGLGLHEDGTVAVDKQGLFQVG